MNFCYHLDQVIGYSQHLRRSFMPLLKAVLNDFQMKLIIKIQVFYLVSNPLNSKDHETAIAVGIDNFFPKLQGR